MRCDAAASVLGRDAARAGEPETTLAPRRPVTPDEEGSRPTRLLVLLERYRGG